MLWRRKEADTASLASKASGSRENTLSKSDTESLEELVKRETPFDEPINPVKRAEFKLTSEQQKMYDDIVAYFEEYVTKEFPIKEGQTVTHPFTDEELAWLTQECFLRYLRALKWVYDTAVGRIKDTLLWRRTYGVLKLAKHPHKEAITADLVAPENETGKEYILGYDVDNRPCLYLRNGYQNTQPSQRQVQHLVFMLETVIQFMPPGQDTLALLIDFKAAPAHMNCNAKFPPINITRDCMHILQYHYPERLGKGLFTNVPWIGHAFFKLASPFIDPYTRLKTIFDGNFGDWVPREQLDKEFKGMLNFEYKHDVYWPKMVEMAEAKQKVYMENFERLGKKIGLSEYDLRLKQDESA
ncbi:hypothetical protein JNB11_08975 [Kocuria palustris]|nr:hypothetical protein [Kocuria palustris]